MKKTALIILAASAALLFADLSLARRWKAKEREKG